MPQQNWLPQDNTIKTEYRGRFAPSPTGRLHLGSLMVAMAVALQAYQHQGSWVLRIEDVDTTRIVAGVEEDIINSLKAHGFQWQEPVFHQTSRFARYQAALEHLIVSGRAFSCACSRTDLKQALIYPGTCREGIPQGRVARSVRLRVPDRVVRFCDQVMGEIEQNLQQDVGDFVIRRADGCFAYQLAVVLDDADQNISEVVRGADLLDSTPRQIFLQESLGLMRPNYLHLPLLEGSDGHKLSKRNFSNPVDSQTPMVGLRLASALLGHWPPDEVQTVDGFWRWAKSNWDMDRIPRMRNIRLGHSEPAVILKHLQQENIL